MVLAEITLSAMCVSMWASRASLLIREESHSLHLDVVEGL